MMGTVAYCSPEQISRGYADARSDVYSAGIVLFELLTGRPPYQGDSAMNVAWQHVHSRVPAPSSRVKGIPNEIDELVVSATDSDPTGRPVDGATFLAEVADVRTELGLPVAPIPARPRAPGQASDLRETRARQNTELINGNGARGHDTQVVGGRPPAAPPEVHPREDVPPPPIVIPPPKQRSARSRRRRRAWIALAVVVIVGALSVFGGIALTRWYQRWNSHVPNLVGQTISRAEAQIEHDHYALGRVSQQFSESVPKDTVISTDPGEGARLEQGGEIDLTVSLGPERVQVPDVHGQDLSAAESALQARDIKFAPPTEVPSRTVGKGKVISVDPKAGTSIKRGALVHLTVSSGPPMVTVPSIAQGTPFDEAKQTLNDGKLKVHEIDEYSDTVAKGGVISVSPSGLVLEGSTVDTKVSLGPEFVTMPSIPLLTPIGDAKAQLEALGLTVRRQVFGGHDTGNRVIDQNIPAGQRVHVGTEVILTVI